MQFFFQSVHEHVRACHDSIRSRRGPHHPCPLLGNEGNFMVQGSLSRKEQSAFPLLSEEGSGVVTLRKKIWSAPLLHFSFHAPLSREKPGECSRWQYMGHVLAVQSPCTRSTTFMYSQYKAQVLCPSESPSAAEKDNLRRHLSFLPPAPRSPSADESFSPQKRQSLLREVKICRNNYELFGKYVLIV